MDTTKGNLLLCGWPLAFVNRMLNGLQNRVVTTIGLAIAAFRAHLIETQSSILKSIQNYQISKHRFCRMQSVPS
jgi:hypothetical protein